MVIEFDKDELEFLDFISKEEENEYHHVMDKLFKDYDSDSFVP